MCPSSPPRRAHATPSRNAKPLRLLLIALLGVPLAHAQTSLSWVTGAVPLSTIASGQTLTISGTNDHDFNGVTLTNNGTIAWTQGRLRSGNNGGINNQGLWTDSAGASYRNDFGGSYTFTNAATGTYRKTGAVTTTFENVAFNNAGVLDLQAGQITLSGGGSFSGNGSASVAGGATLAFNSNYTITDAAKLSGTGSYLLSSGTLTLDGTLAASGLKLHGGTLAGSPTFNNTVSWTTTNLNTAGTLTIGTGGTLSISATNDHDFNSRSLVNHGIVEWTQGRLRSGAGGGITNHGQWKDSASSVYRNDFGGAYAFTNAPSGTYTKSAAGTTLFDNVGFDNSGAVTVSAGTLQLHGGGSSSGTFNAGPDTTVLFSNSYTIADGSSLLGTGTYRVTGGTFTVTGNVSVAGFQFAGGRLAGTHTFSGGLTWNGGNLDSSGTTTIGPSATLTLAPTLAGNPFDHDFNTRTLVNNGTVDWQAGSGRLRSGTGGGIVNNALWKDAGGSSYRNDFGGTFNFNNAATGTYRKTGTGTTSFENVPFNNAGTLDLQAGQITLSGGGAFSGNGNAAVAADATLYFNSNYTIPDATKLTGLGSYTLGSSTLTLSGIVNAPGLKLQGGTLAGSHTFANTVPWTATSLSTAGTTTIAATGTLTISGTNDHDFTSRSLINHGTVEWTQGRLRSGHDGSIANHGQWKDSAGSSYRNDFGGNYTFTNSATGTYTKTGNTTSSFDNVPFNNHGTVTVSAGTLSLAGGGTNSGTGTFNVAENAAVRFTNNYSITDGSKLLGAGTYQVTGGTLTVSGNVNVNNFSVSGGSLAGTHAFTGALAWNGGSLNTSGTTTIASGGTLTVSGAIDHDFNTRSLVNQGTIEWTAGRLRSGNGGGIENRAAFNDSASTAFNNDWGGTAPFTNAASGIYTKSALGTTRFDARFDNHGRVDVNKGTLQLNGGGTNFETGSINAADGASVVFSSHYTLADASSLQGAGAFSLTGGTLTASGNVNVSNFAIAGGVLAGTQTFNGGLSWSGGNLNTAGSTTIASGTTFTISPNSAGNPFDHDFNTRSLINRGTITWAPGAGRLRSGNGGGVVNHGLFVDASDSDFNNDYGGTTPATFTNQAAGTYRKTSTGTTDFFLPLVNSGKLDVQAGTLALHSGGTLHDGGLTLGPGLLRLVNGILTATGTTTFANFEVFGGSIAGTHTLGGKVLWTAGDFNNNGQTTVSGTFEIGSTNDHNFNSHAFINTGTVNWTGGRLRSGNAGSFTNQGAFNDTASSTWNNDWGGTVSRFVNAPSGTYDKKGAGTTTFLVPFDNNGTLSTTVGILQLGNGGTSSATARFDAATDTALRFTGGSYTVADAAAFTGPGRFEIAGGTVTLAGTSSAADFQLTGGTLAGTHRFAGTLRWTPGGNMNAAGTTTIAPSGTLNIAGIGDHDFNGHAILNQGTVNWSGGNLRAGTGATFTNQGIFKDTADADMNSAYGGTSLKFVNAAGGSYNKEGAGITDYFIPFENHGTVHVTGGPLALHSGGTIGDGAAFTGDGQARLVNGTFTATGNISSTSLTLAGATLAGTHALAGTVTFVNGNLNAPGTTTIASGGTLVYGSGADFDFNGRSLVNRGTFDWRAGAGNLRAGGGATFTNEALFLDAANADINNAWGGTVLTFLNSASGTYRKTGDGLTDIWIPFTNRGTVDSRNGTLALRGGGAIESGASFVGAGVTHLAGGTFAGSGTFSSSNLHLAGGTLAGTPTVQGTLVWHHGPLASGASLTVDASGKLAIATPSDHDLPGHALVNHGTIEWTDGNIRGGSSATITNHGMFIDSADNDINNAYGGTTLTFTNAPTGTFRKTAATTTDLLVPLINHGTVDVQAGTLALHTGGTLHPGSSFTGAGSTRLINGTLSATGAFHSTNLVLAGGALSGTPTLRGTVAWHAGDLASGATTTVADDGRLVISTTADHDLPGHHLVNRGLIDWQEGNIRAGGAATITNHGVFRSTATHNINNAYGSTPLTFTNAPTGTFEKTGGVTTTLFVPFVNQGTVRVSAGALVFSNTFTNSGSLELANGAAAHFSGPLTVDAALRGTGTIHGSVTAGGLVAPGNSAGTLTITNALTLLSTSELLFELGGASKGTEYDHLAVGGLATLAGKLSVSFLNGYQNSILSGAQFTLLTGTTLTGAFANVPNGGFLTTSDGAGIFQVNYGPSFANSVVLSNFQAIPEPSTVALLALGLAPLLLRRRRRR